MSGRIRPRVVARSWLGPDLARLRESLFLRAPFQISKRAPGKAAEFSRSRVELLRVIGASRFERGEPPAETCKLIRRQLSNSFSDFLDLHLTTPEA